MFAWVENVAVNAVCTMDLVQRVNDMVTYGRFEQCYNRVQVRAYQRPRRYETRIHRTESKTFFLERSWSAESLQKEA